MISVRRPVVPVLVLAALAALAPSAAPVTAAEPAVTSFSVSGSPFATSFAPLPTQVSIRLVLASRARVTLAIRRPNGTVVRRLARRVWLDSGEHSWTWDGRLPTGAQVRNGRYFVRLYVYTPSGTEQASRPLRKGLPPIYPVNPGAIVVVVDPGHGGRFNNAHGPGLLEKTANLDIGLQLQALLERAGVQVVMTRTTDVAVNDPPSDENGDGILNRYDDDLERNDVANLARGDVNIHVHNNGSSHPVTHGTGTYITARRTWMPIGLELAADIQAAQVEALEAYRSAQFAGTSYLPNDHGVKFGWYYYLGPYDPPFLPRPSLVVGVLSESLYLSNTTDLEALKRPEVRLSIAAALYVGIAQWLNSRAYGAGYEELRAPTTAEVGAALSYRVRVTNRGNTASQGWTLRLGAVPAVHLYDGSGARGDELGRVAVPDGLAPGASIDLVVPAVAPAAAGEWLVKSDLVLADGTYLSDQGVVSLQMPLTVTIAP